MWVCITGFRAALLGLRHALPHSRAALLPTVAHHALSRQLDNGAAFKQFGTVGDNAIGASFHVAVGFGARTTMGWVFNALLVFEDFSVGPARTEVELPVREADAVVEDEMGRDDVHD